MKSNSKTPLAIVLLLVVLCLCLVVGVLLQVGIDTVSAAAPEPTIATTPTVEPIISATEEWNYSNYVYLPAITNGGQ